MVEVARVVSSYDLRRRVFCERVKVRCGDQRVVVALANKVLRVIWFMLIWKEEYEFADMKSYARKLNLIE